MTDDFPYKNLSMNFPDVLKRFQRLQNYRFRLQHKRFTVRNMTTLSPTEVIYQNPFANERSPTTIHAPTNEYLRYDLLSDYWQDQCRMRANRLGFPSPYEYWQEHKSEIRDAATQRINQGFPESEYQEPPPPDRILDYWAREIIYESVVEATAFKPIWMTGFIRLYGSRRVLDFSAGWGDRLLGAMAAGVELYCGVDPNSCLMEGYQHMLEDLVHGADVPGRYVYVNSPFEICPEQETTIGEIVSGEVSAIPVLVEGYDLVLTSPPFFDLEIYSSDSTQSLHYADTVKARGVTPVDAWFHKFLIPAIEKAWRLLSVKGFLVLNITDKPSGTGSNYTYRMIETINSTFADARYLGVIGYMDKKQEATPFWIWAKAPGRR